MSIPSSQFAVSGIFPEPKPLLLPCAAIITPSAIVSAAYAKSLALMISRLPRCKAA